MQRIICEEEPTKPSTKLGTMGEVLTDIAKHRKTNPNLLPRLVRGDLDWIVMKSLEKDRTRRYDTAAELAVDIGRHLNSEPVHAAAPSFSYKLHKFIRRHRVGVVLSIMATIAVLLTIITLSISTAVVWKEQGRTQRALEREQKALGQETQARTEAERQTKIAQAVVNFLNKDLLASVTPARARGRQVTVREILDTASQKIEGRFKDEPLIEASVRQTLGKTYTELGEYAEAARHLEQARQLHQEHLEPDHPSALQSMKSLGWLYLNQGRYQEAEPLLLKSLEITKRVLGEEHPSTLAHMSELGVLYENQHRYEKAEALYLKTVEIMKRVLGEQHLHTLNTMHNLATLYSDQGLYQEAEMLYRKTLEIKQSRFGEEHPDTLRTMNNLALLYRKQGWYEESEALCLKTVEIMKRVLGEEHLDTLRSMNNLATLYGIQDQSQKAESLHRNILKVRIRVLGDEHPDTLASMNNLAITYHNQGRYQEAEPLYFKTVEIRKRMLGEEHPDTLLSLHNLADLYCHQGRYQEAEPLYLKTVEIRKRVLGKSHPDTLKALNLMVALYEAWDKPEEAQKWRSNLSEGEKEIENKIKKLLGPAPDGNGRRRSGGHQATAPSPVNASDISPTPTVELRWTPALDAVAHRIYFGADPQSLVLLAEVRNNNRVNSPELEKQRWYCWRVNAIRSDGSVIEGELWSFSTGDLVGWWRFDETEGRTAADSSGRGNDGKLIGNPQWQPGRIDGALAFDGLDDYVSIKDTPDFDIAAEITVACWIKVTKFDKPWQAITAKGNLAWRIIRAHNSRNIEFACTGVNVPNTVWGNVYGRSVVDDSKWHHLAGVYDGMRVCLYVDGVLDASIEGTGEMNTNDDYVLIGANAGDAWRYWHGLIDDVRVYSYALSEAQVKEIYAGRGPGPNKKLPLE